MELGGGVDLGVGGMMVVILTSYLMLAVKWYLRNNKMK